MFNSNNRKFYNLNLEGVGQHCFTNDRQLLSYSMFLSKFTKLVSLPKPPSRLHCGKYNFAEQKLNLRKM